MTTARWSSWRSRPHQFLMSIPAKAQTQTPAPDAAESCSFTKPTEYTCKLKSGLKFSNGDPLTAKDVAFTLPARLSRSTTPTARRPCSATWPRWRLPTTAPSCSPSRPATTRPGRYVLGTSAGPIVDSKVFPPDKLLPRRADCRLRPVQDLQLQQEPAGPVRCEPELRWPEQAADVEGCAEVLHHRVQLEARRPERRHRHCVAQPDPDRHRQPAKRERCQGADRPGRRTALHRLQLQDDAGQ